MTIYNSKITFFLTNRAGTFALEHEPDKFTDYNETGHPHYCI